MIDHQKDFYRDMVRNGYERHPEDVGVEHYYDLSEKNITYKELPAVIEQIQQHQEQVNERQALLLVNLYGNQIGQKGCQFLAKSHLMSKVTLLTLECNNIDDKACKYLSKCNWGSLKILSIPDSKIRENGCRQLSKMQQTNLSKLQIKGNKIGRLGYAFIKSKFSKAIILPTPRPHNFW